MKKALGRVTAPLLDSGRLCSLNSWDRRQRAVCPAGKLLPPTWIGGVIPYVHGREKCRMNGHGRMPVDARWKVWTEGNDI